MQFREKGKAIQSLGANLHWHKPGTSICHVRIKAPNMEIIYCAQPCIGHEHRVQISWALSGSFKMTMHHRLSTPPPIYTTTYLQHNLAAPQVPRRQSRSEHPCYRGCSKMFFFVQNMRCLLVHALYDTLSGTNLRWEANLGGTIRQDGPGLKNNH